MRLLTITMAALFTFFGCKQERSPLSFLPIKKVTTIFDLHDFDRPIMDKSDSLMTKYVPFTLSADLTSLTPNEQKMIPLLIDAAKIMDDLFWQQAYGDKEELLSSISDSTLRAFAMINYGPWDRLDGNTPFIDGVGDKPLGANFYPPSMIKEELEQTELEGKDGLYNIIRRNDKDGSLYTIPYHKAFESEVNRAAFLLEQASSLADDPGLKKYLELRSKALLTSDYQESDFAWLDMKDNKIDVVIGPIETYEDQMFGYKAAFEAYVLLKDIQWSQRLSRYATFLPELQTNLPVAAKYKAEKPGLDTELNAYDVLYYSGDCNAGSKTIAINLPNDEQVQLQKGTRRLQLKNAMKAKYDKILIPIADELIDDSQRKHITFDAFFANTMFHEVAHGLGIKNTIDGTTTVRLALKEYASAIEEGKADILGLYMVTSLFDKGELEGDIRDYIVTFMASIFRSVRFGASSAHGKANMIRFNYFNEYNAFTKDSKSGKYTINYDNFTKAVRGLTNDILVMQGNGDYKKVDDFMKKYAGIQDELQADLDNLTLKGIPIDVVFKQGVEYLNMEE